MPLGPCHPDMLLPARTARPTVATFYKLALIGCFTIGVNLEVIFVIIYSSPCHILSHIDIFL